MANPTGSRKPTNALRRKRLNAAEVKHDDTIPPGLALLPLAIPAYWTPEQAQAVIELLDDLRDRICTHYQVQLIDLYREQHGFENIDPPDTHDDQHTHDDQLF
jgi:hypothetical protein